MIKANELRIGNWVKERITMMQEIEPSVVVNEYYIQIASKHFCGTRYEFFPIPLTPKILEKCGFESHTKGMVVFNGIFIGSYINGFYLADKNEFHIGKVPLNCVHQLQNLYFVLTGEELKINRSIMKKECEHEFIDTGRCRPRICKLCGENEPQIQHDLKITLRGEELKFDKDFILEGTTITLKNPIY